MNKTIHNLLVSDKGILALDWSPKTIFEQFNNVGLVSTPELNRMYRQMLVTTTNLNDYVSGVILHEETINQKLDSGMTFPEFLNNIGIIVGARADEGSSKFVESDQNMTEGLNGLSKRLRDFSEKGVKFTKWRAGFRISDIYPSNNFIEESVNRLVEFAKVSHQFGMVALVEPDVEMTGNHTTTRCGEITTKILKNLFSSLLNSKIDITKLILKVNMVLPGIDSGVVAKPLEVANATLRTLRNSVPNNVGGIVFLSGGQSYDDAVMHLDMIQDLAVSDPWKISFSFARALQKDALEEWRGLEENIDGAQNILSFRLQKVSKARMGEL